MGLIVDLSTPPLSPPVVVTSPDGVLSVERDEAWAGVEVTVDFRVPEVRNLVTNPGMQATDGTVEVGRNLATNPSYEVSVASTSGYNGAVAPAAQGVSTEQAWIGAQSFKVTAATGATALGARYIGFADQPAGTVVPVTVRYYVPASQTGLTSMRVLFRDDAAGDNMLSVSGLPAPVPGQWNEVTYTFTVPAGRSLTAVYAFGEGTINAGDVCYIDGWQIGTDGNYFDGDTPDDDTFTYTWTGIPNASESVKTARTLAGWTATGGTAYQSGTGDTATGVVVADGPEVMTATYDTALTVAPGDQVTVLATTTGDRAATVNVGWLDAQGISISLTPGPTATAPEGAAQALLVISWPAGNKGDVCGWDKAMLTPGDYTGGYGDGGTEGWVWDGAPDASTSRRPAGFVGGTEPHHIRVWRRNPDGTVHLVRGANPNLSPGGIAPAYDHEAPLGALCSWWAVGYDRFNQELYTTGEAALTLPWPDACTAWLKSIVDPDASRKVEVVSWDEGGRDSRTTMHQILGDSARVARFGTPGTLTATLSLRTHTRGEYEDLQVLLNTGWLLLDATDEHGIPTPLYLVRTGELPIERQDYPGWDDRVMRVTVEAVNRPPTSDSPMLVPGSSWAALPYNSWTEAGQAAETYLDL